MIPGTKWARRYGAYARRTCARPGCGIPAAATLRFLPTQREAWLVDLDDAAARTEGDLCARHAAALVLPRGWQLHDERSRTEPLAEQAVPETRARVRTRPRRATLVAVREPQPQLDLEEPAAAVLTAEPEPQPEPAPEPEPAEPQEPRPEPRVVGEVLADVLDAQTPLLKRAFQNVWPLGTDD
jgi:DNA polymerase-3 subunit gamma/tau